MIYNVKNIMRTEKLQINKFAFPKRTGHVVMIHLLMLYMNQMNTLSVPIRTTIVVPLKG